MAEWRDMRQKLIFSALGSCCPALILTVIKEAKSFGWPAAHHFELPGPRGFHRGACKIVVYIKRQRHSLSFIFAFKLVLATNLLSLIMIKLADLWISTISISIWLALLITEGETAVVGVLARLAAGEVCGLLQLVLASRSSLFFGLVFLHLYFNISMIFKICLYFLIFKFLCLFFPLSKFLNF